VGVPLPETCAAAVASVVERVRAQPLPAGARDVRWVRLDGLHLTLRFLGPTPDHQIDRTITAVRHVAASAAGPVDLELTGAGAFPRAERPRTLWIGVGGDLAGLASLARTMEEALVEAGWPAETRPFAPHLTLARSDGIAVGPLVARRLSEAMRDRSIDCHLDRLGLFESVTGGGPARYVPVVLESLASMPSTVTPVYHRTTPDRS
jgi:RNA 2',3'-cyclic 3'-phosphodiesterase